MGLFGKKQPVQPPPPPEPEPLTIKEQVKEQKRNIDKAIRELDRERMKLEQQDKVIQGQIRKAAKENQIEAARMMAKDLAMNRQQVKRLYQMRTQLQGVSMQMSTVQSTATMTQVMGSAVSSMAALNSQVDMPSMTKVVMEYEKQTGKMAMTQEMMQDAMEDAMGTEELDQDTEAIVDQVLDELGVEAMDKLGTTTAYGTGQDINVTNSTANPDAEFEKRMADLRR